MSHTSNHVGVRDQTFEEGVDLHHLLLLLPVPVLPELERLWNILLEEVSIDGVHDL